MAESPTRLKDWFDEPRYRNLAAELADVCKGFKREAFLRHVLEGLEERELLQRLRRTTEAVHRALPGDYEAHLDILRRLAPRLRHGFVGILPCDYVGCYGLEQFELSMEALREFTGFGSGEFAVREFLRVDQERGLEIMLRWAGDPNEHVRRLASEGARPRLPWSFRLESLVRDPRPTRKILETLRCDPSLYVRKSVANHLNDISKDHPGFMLEILEAWDLSDERSAWIAKHACRSLIKAGDARSLALFKVGTTVRLDPPVFSLSKGRLRIGESLDLRVSLHSSARASQRLVVDFAVYFARESGRPSRKVFKWKFMDLAAGVTVTLGKKIAFVQRSTRRLIAGEHRVELLVNGNVMAESDFVLGAEK